VATPGVGTSAVVSNIQAGAVTEYDPIVSSTDQNGEVAGPNVDITSDAVQQAIDSYALVADAYAMSIYKKVMRTLLNVQT
jgi:flagellar basal body rod protein FlgC